MILDIPKFDNRKDLFKYLVENKRNLIGYKKIGEKKAMPVGFNVADKSLSIEQGKALKMQDDKGDLVIDVIANLAGWMDYDNDVIIRGAYNKSIADKGNNFPFLRDHEYSMKAIIAKTLEVYTKEFSLTELGIRQSNATAQALMFKAQLNESFSGDMHAKYKHGLVKQHSIGMRYMNIELAMNDADFKEEFASWQKYIGEVINFAKAEENGYFWAIREIGLIENSAVVFGSNSITPVISIEESKEAVIDTSKAKVSEAAQSTSSKSILNFLQNL